MPAIKKRILITGGAGFIGFHLASRLGKNAETQIVLVDNFIRGMHDEELQRLLAQSNITLMRGDLTDPATYAQFGDGYDEVYHLAAIIGVQNVMDRPHEVLRVNAVATLNLLDWYVAGGGERLLFSSTSEAYAWTQHFYPLPIPTPEAVPLALTELENPRSTYAASKIFGETAVIQYCKRHKKPFAIVRFHNVYGPRMGVQHVIPELYQRLVSGQNPLTVYSADHQRAFCYISDAVEATIAALRTASTANHTFNVGNDQEEITIEELANRIASFANVDCTIAPELAAHDPIRRRCPDLTRAREILGYEPQISLDEGLSRTLTWYRNFVAFQTA